jgi:hypothetical protein
MPLFSNVCAILENGVNREVFFSIVMVRRIRDEKPSLTFLGFPIKLKRPTI